MNRVAERRFLGGHSPLSGQQILMIADYMWWANNEDSILAWMDDNLPRGADHQRGMILTFDNEQQRSWFLLKWA